ncbi:hypothetical protein GW17_00033367 [Ensete ventricosum]|nr:hypothetical protein GW17_00033367 [Ensete ventricosum]
MSIRTSTTRRQSGEAYASMLHHFVSSSFLLTTVSFGVMPHYLLYVDTAWLYLLFILADHRIIRCDTALLPLR